MTTEPQEEETKGAAEQNKDQRSAERDPVEGARRVRLTQKTTVGPVEGQEAMLPKRGLGQEPMTEEEDK